MGQSGLTDPKMGQLEQISFTEWVEDKSIYMTNMEYSIKNYEQISS
jgi:hypothetical protein